MKQTRTKQKRRKGTQYYESVCHQFEQVISVQTPHLLNNALAMVKHYQGNNARLADMNMLATAIQTHSEGRKVTTIPALPCKRGKDAGSRRRGPRAAGTGNRVRYPYVMQIGNKRRPVSEETFSIYTTLREHGTLSESAFRRQLADREPLDSAINRMLDADDVEEERRIKVRNPGNVLNRLRAMLTAEPDLAPDAYDALMISTYHPGFATKAQRREIWNCALQIVPERTSAILPESCDIMYAAKMRAAKNSIPELADIAALASIEFGASRWYTKLSRSIPAYEKKTLSERLGESNTMTPAEIAGARYALGQNQYGEKREAAGRALVGKYFREAPHDVLRTAIEVYEHDKERIAESKGKPDNAVLALSKPQYAALHKFFTAFDMGRFKFLQPRRQEAVGEWISSRFFLEEMVKYLPKVADVAAMYGDGVREKEDLDKKMSYLRKLELTSVGPSLGNVLNTAGACITYGKRNRPLDIRALERKPFLRKEEVAVINKLYDAAQNMFGVTDKNTPAYVDTLVRQAQELSVLQGRVFYALSDVNILPFEASDLFARAKNVRVVGGVEMIDPAKVRENHERVLHSDSYKGPKRAYVAVSSVGGLAHAVRWLDEQGDAKLGPLADAVRLNSESTYVDKRLAEQLKRAYARSQKAGRAAR